MKKTYYMPEFEFTKFSITDIINASTGGEGNLTNNIGDDLDPSMKNWDSDNVF